MQRDERNNRDNTCNGYKYHLTNLHTQEIFLLCCIIIVFLVLYLFSIFIVFNYSLYSVLFCISFRCTAQWLDNHMIYKVFPLIFLVPTQHHTELLHTIDYIPYAALSIPVASLSHQLVLLNPFTSHPTLNLPWQPPLSETLAL